MGREWETWLTELQNEISLLRKLDPDKLFTTKASDMRVGQGAGGAGWSLRKHTFMDDARVSPCTYDVGCMHDPWACVVCAWLLRSAWRRT